LVTYGNLAEEARRLDGIRGVRRGRMNGHPIDIPGRDDPGKASYFACPDRLHAKRSPLADPICLKCPDRPLMDQVGWSEFLQIRATRGTGDGG
jgi:hypothetical protein